MSPLNVSMADQENSMDFGIRLFSLTTFLKTGKLAKLSKMHITVSLPTGSILYQKLKG